MCQALDNPFQFPTTMLVWVSKEYFISRKDTYPFLNPLSNFRSLSKVLVFKVPFDDLFLRVWCISMFGIIELMVRGGGGGGGNQYTSVRAECNMSSFICQPLSRAKPGTTCFIISLVFGCQIGLCDCIKVITYYWKWKTGQKRIAYWSCKCYVAVADRDV